MTRHIRAMLILGALAALPLVSPSPVAAQGHEAHHAARDTAAKPGALPGIPGSIKVEHAEIHERLAAATKMKGAVGEAARAVAAVLDPHFVREEQIALPPLGLLRPLSEGRSVPNMAAVLPLTDSLRAELPTMLAEHVKIGAAVERMGRVARANGATQVAALADAIRLHARTEEEVLYPAAVLVGEVVRARAR